MSVRMFNKDPLKRMYKNILPNNSKNVVEEFEMNNIVFLYK